MRPHEKMNSNPARPTPPSHRLVRAVLAEDEPVLARGLVRALNAQWPELHLDAVVHDGHAAIEAASTHLPDVLFLDIQMPEVTGLQAARHVIDDWPDPHPLPLIVFITAFDRFAIDAFEQGAVDYVLKPVDPERLKVTVLRLQSRLREREDHAVRALQAGQAIERQSALPPLHHIQAAAGGSLHVVPIGEVRHFVADDKYVHVHTADRVWLIRTPLRELATRLPPEQFVQIHRGCIVRWSAISKVVRDDMGRLRVHMADNHQTFWVSRSHAHHFKAM